MQKRDVNCQLLHPFSLVLGVLKDVIGGSKEIREV